MKKLTSTLFLVLALTCFGQESTKGSFLSKNKPLELFQDYKSLENSPGTFQLNLPLDVNLNQAYQSDFKNFMANDPILMNYPMGELGQTNDIVFGNYMNTSFNLGNKSLNTIYIFDQTGRFINSRTSFSFGKKK